MAAPRGGRMMWRQSNVWFGFFLGCIAMLSLQSTFLRPPYPSALSFPSSFSKEKGNIESLLPHEECDGLAGMKILLLDIHLEGNLGDEMETIPLLQELKRCGIHVTAVLSRWLERPEQRIGGSSVREHALIDVILDPTSLDVISTSSEYYAVLLAPGPWRLCPLKNYWPHRIDIFMGGSIIPEQPDRDCDLGERLQGWKPSLLVVREPYSYGRLQVPPLLDNVQSIMGGDLSHSFQPVNVTLDYWKNIYARYEERILVFARGSNADNVIQPSARYVELSTLMNGIVSIPATQVIFATSSPLEDAEWMQQWRQRFTHFRDHQFIQCQSVEQLWGLISQSTHVYTDRYHPGVVAHIFDKEVTVLNYKEEQTKLVGLTQLIASNKFTPTALRDEYNPRAFQMLRHTLHQLKRRPLEPLNGKALTDADEEHRADPTREQPYAIVVGLPKSGTTSMYHFFSCSGYHTTHYCCCGSTATEYPCTGGKLLSEQLWKNMQADRPLWEDTGDMFVHTQLDGESKTETYILPQHYHLKELDESAPNAIWILPLRSPSSWKNSVQNWLDTESRLRVLYERHYPKTSDFDLATFYDMHTAKIRDYCSKYRQKEDSCVEVQIDDPHSGKDLAKHFRNAVASCWGRHNAGPFFQALPPKV